MMVSAKAFPGWMVRWITAVLLAIFLMFGLQSAIPAHAEVSAWQALQEVIDRAGDGEIITLSEDLTALEADAEITIPAGKRLTLDLNGHALDSSMEPNQAGNKRSVIKINAGAILTLRDSGGSGTLTGGFHDNGAGILNNGTLIMEGGRVTGNTALDSGGGIANYGTMVITGGIVTGNTAMRDGSQVFNGAKGHLTVGGGILPDSGDTVRSSIRNEETLTVMDAQSGDVRMEDMPALTHFIARLSVFPVAALLLALLLTVWLDAYLSRERKRVMGVIIALVFALLFQNYWDNRLSLAEAYNALRIPLSVLGYALRPMILVMFLYIVKPDGRYRGAWALASFNAAIYMTAFFSDIAFHFTSSGHFMSGPLRHTCTLVSAALYAWLFLLTMRQFRPRERKESWIPILLTVLIGGAVAMDFTVAYSDQPISFLTMAIAISCVFYYIWLHLQLVREHEDGLRAEQRIQMMKTQIQPHFLFNTLNTIRAVYAMDPPLADQTLGKFSKYLRQNLDAMEQPDLIPFSKELEHTRLYADIEMLRFPYIRMEYRIQDEDFVIPPLTVQPLVENAIRHGVRVREEGTISVSTRRDESCHIVEIRDNGIGFDPKAPRKPGETHIGIENVRNRMEQLCGGSLEIESEVGKGTCVAIRIPVSAHESGKEQTA